MSDRIDDTDPDREPINGEETGRPATDHERLVRLDERSRLTIERILGLESEMRGMRADQKLIYGRFIEVERRLDLVAQSVREGLASVPDLARRSADESGEYVHQELVNLQAKLAQKDQEASAAKLLAEKERADRLERAAEEAKTLARAEKAEASARSFQLLLAIITAGLTGVVGWLLWVLAHKPPG